MHAPPILHDLKTLIGCSVFAADGRIGNVKNFLFDDRSWTVHYLVVEVGGWLTRKNVILPLTPTEQPDWETKTFHLRFTKEQMRDSPALDGEESVSSQQEMAMEEYFGKLAYWVDRELGASNIPTGRKYPLNTNEASHLRGIWNLSDYRVWAAAGELGRVGGFLMDEGSWHIGHLSLKPMKLLSAGPQLVPTNSVTSVSWADRRIQLFQDRTA